MPPRPKGETDNTFSMSTPLYLIRHTRPAIESGICYGQSDIPLAESFNDEVGKLQKLLVHHSFAQAYTSPLKRCALLAEALNLQAIPDPRLMEMNFGDWEGKRWDHIFASTAGKRWFDNYLTTPCPGGESFSNLIQRVAAFFTAIRPALPPLEQLEHAPLQLQIDAPLCLVTHAGVIRAALVLLCGVKAREVFDIEVPYGHVVEVTNNTFSLTYFS